MSSRRCILAFALLLLAAPHLGAQEEPAADPAPAGDPPPAAPLTLERYIESFQDFQQQVHEATGMTITTTIIPDLYLYGLAKCLDEAKRGGLSPEKVGERMRAEHKKLKKLKEQRILIRIEIEPASPMNHLFLQKKTESHVQVDGEGKVWSATEGAPAPRFEKWQIIQGASMKNFNLARFEKLRFDVEIRKKNTEVCRLQLIELLHYHELPRRSEYETKGINVGARQISLHTIRDMALDPISIELAPATWKPPAPPAELEEWRKQLDSGTAGATP